MHGANPENPIDFQIVCDCGAFVNWEIRTITFVGPQQWQWLLTWESMTEVSAGSVLRAHVAGWRAGGAGLLSLATHYTAFSELPTA